MIRKVSHRVAVEKPENGLAGIKHWRHDLVAGLLVSLISLPFSLGIAVASGAPPIAGLVSAIIAGLLMPFLGGAYVTISGPAAGLAPILLVSMTALGRGDRAVGYPLLLGVICIAGVVQLVLSYFKAARFSALFPSSVVEGMLAAIGLLIIGKQLPNFIGRTFHEHEFFGILGEAPSQIMELHPQVFLIGGCSLVMIFALSAAKARWLKIVPPQVLAVVFATIAAWLMNLDSAFLIHLPEGALNRAFAFPDFSHLISDSSLWVLALTTVVTLVLIDGVESLATALAVDKIDPFRRKSNPNRVLMAMGVSNICSSIVGGLTIIPGGVKSKACIVAGGRTLWANFYNAMFLILFVVAGKDVINMIPLSALAAVLIFTGYKLCEPHIWSHVAKIGPEQLLVFSATVVGTLCTDLLVGIALGVIVKLMLNLWFLWFVSSASRHSDVSSGSATARRSTIWTQAASLFKNPAAKCGMHNGAYHIYFEGPLVCFNNLQVQNELKRIPANAEAVYLNLHNVPMVDHTSCEFLLNYLEEKAENGCVKVEIRGLDGMFRPTDFATCMRLAYPVAAAPTSKDPVWSTPVQFDVTDEQVLESPTAPSDPNSSVFRKSRRKMAELLKRNAMRWTHVGWFRWTPPRSTATQANGTRDRFTLTENIAAQEKVDRDIRVIAMMPFEEN